MEPVLIRLLKTPVHVRVCTGVYFLTHIIKILGMPELARNTLRVHVQGLMA